MYNKLTDYLSLIGDKPVGVWGPFEQKGDGSEENPIQMPFVIYERFVNELIQEVYVFEREHPEYGLNRYHEILERNGIRWDSHSMTRFDVANADGQCVMGLLMAAVRAERFCDGALLDFFSKGTIQQWLLRLKELDENIIT